MILIDVGDKIEKIIEELYECKFTGKAVVDRIDKDTYNLKLILNSFYVPLNLTMNGTEEEFLAFVIDQLKKKRLDRTEYFSGYKNESGKYYSEN